MQTTVGYEYPTMVADTVTKLCKKLQKFSSNLSLFFSKLLKLEMIIRKIATKNFCFFLSSFFFLFFNNITLQFLNYFSFLLYYYPLFWLSKNFTNLLIYCKSNCITLCSACFVNKFYL